MISNNMIWFLIIGAVAGWIAGELWKGYGFGLLGNLVIGIIGAFIGGHIFVWLGIAVGGMVGTLVMAVVGALALLFVVGLLKRV